MKQVFLTGHVPSTRAGDAAFGRIEDLLEFSLEESAGDIRRCFGVPVRSLSTSRFLVYDYQEFDRNEYGWSFVFDSRDAAAVCVTRRFMVQQDFDRLFPAECSAVHASRGAAVRVRRLAGSRVLVGFGRHQLVLVREDSVGRIFPWLGSTTG